jgi:hypothetical protein
MIGLLQAAIVAFQAPEPPQQAAITMFQAAKRWLRAPEISLLSTDA